jgi:hypothetical protein
MLMFGAAIACGFPRQCKKQVRVDLVRRDGDSIPTPAAIAQLSKRSSNSCRHHCDDDSDCSS